MGLLSVFLTLLSPVYEHKVNQSICKKSKYGILRSRVFTQVS
jgi:hypothetical protein